MIRMQGITREFGSGDNTVQVLKGIDLTIEAGEFIAIIGQSGSGKSTLMNILGCLDSATGGSYSVGGKETAHLNPDELAALRRQKFGFIFQRYNLLSALSARDNVALPAVYAGMPQAQRNARAEALLQELGLEHKAASRPNELSGGQQQRVSIARALMNGGEILLADEPTGALDSESGLMVMDIITRLHRQGHTVIVVTHDPNIAAYAERVIEIKDGQIIRDTRQRPPAAQGTLNSLPQKHGLGFYKDQFLEAFSMSVQAVAAHKLRSLLTMLGIIIGIASVVSVVALGKGSQEKILENISAMGTNTISIFPGEGAGDMNAAKVKSLSVEDAQIIAAQSYVQSATPNTGGGGTVTWRNSSLSAQANGVGAQSFDVSGLKLARGRFFNEDDVRHNAQVAVIDANTVAKLFPAGHDPIGEVILFNKRPLRVIGTTQKETNRFAISDELNIYAPYTTVMNQITGTKSIGSITVKVRDDVTSQVAEKNLTDLLKSRHGSQDFFTHNLDSIKQTIEATTNTMTLLISSIALISLVVGGIGVMNIMLVSVTERTREIGIRMAIGARRHNILQQFLIEAVLICLIGGMAGIALSWLISVAFNHLVSDFAMSFSPASIATAVLCSSAIGVVFGFMPARNASRLNPIEALSRE